MGLAIIKSESFYFHDGDVVLLSLPKDNVVTAFKIDRAFLLRSSPVFEGMFSLPPSIDLNIESHDGVPLVKLQDEADHLTMFLKALHDSRCIPWKKHDRDTVRTVEGILLLATKYQVDHLRERIVSLLERDWPSKLSEWDINKLETIARVEEELRDWDEPYHKDPLPEPCEVIRLARKCDIPSILPAAFYQLSRIRGLTDYRISGPILNYFNKYERPYNEPVADFSLLTAEDFRCLVVGRDAMFNAFQDYMQSAMFEIQHNHTTGSDFGKCRKGLSGLEDQLEMRMLYYLDDPLSLMKESALGHRIHPTPEVCGDCREQFVCALNAKREALWEQLSVFFLLQSK